MRKSERDESETTGYETLWRVIHPGRPRHPCRVIRETTGCETGRGTTGYEPGRACHPACHTLTQPHQKFCCTQVVSNAIKSALFLTFSLSLSLSTNTHTHSPVVWAPGDAARSKLARRETSSQALSWCLVFASSFETLSKSRHFAARAAASRGTPVPTSRFTTNQVPNPLTVYSFSVWTDDRVSPATKKMLDIRSDQWEYRAI